MSEYIYEDGVEHIVVGALRGRSNITRVVLPASVLSISAYAFADMPDLREVVVSRRCSRIAPTAFEGAKDLTIISEHGFFPETFANNNNYKFKDITEVS